MSKSQEKFETKWARLLLALGMEDRGGKVVDLRNDGNEYEYGNLTQKRELYSELVGIKNDREQISQIARDFLLQLSVLNAIASKLTEDDMRRELKIGIETYL